MNDVRGPRIPAKEMNRTGKCALKLYHTIRLLSFSVTCVNTVDTKHSMSNDQTDEDLRAPGTVFPQADCFPHSSLDSMAFLVPIVKTFSSPSQCPSSSREPISHRTSFLPPTTIRRTQRAQIQNRSPVTISFTPTRCSIQALPSSTRPNLLTILSTIVGVCVLIGSLLYKIPQVVRVMRRRSAEGISILMYALETIGTTFSAVYFARKAFPFATYGESVFIMAQNVAVMALIVLYEKLPRAPAFLAAVLYVALLILLYSSVIPMRYLMFLQICSIPILNLARVPQIVLNFRRKSTGELSPITLGLQLLGNVARIFTTIAQVRDPLMFAGITVATLFNSTLFFQWIYYSRRTPKIVESVPNS